MNGKKAREVRRRELPPDLAADARRQIVEAAKERAAAQAKASTDYTVAERTARLRKTHAYGEAEAEFARRRAEILEEASARAGDRQTGVRSAA